MPGCHSHVRNSHERVRSCRKDNQGLTVAFDFEPDVHTFGTPDPVTLHRAHRVGPALQLFKLVQKFIGIGGCFHKPLGHFAPLYRGPRSPALTVNNLLVCQHRLVNGVPVHNRVFAVNQSFLEHAGKQPLLPAVVIRLTCYDLARPVVAVSEEFELRAHLVDVLVCPIRGRHFFIDGSIFCRHAKCIEADGLQHVQAMHAAIPTDDIANGVIADVAHVQPPAWIGQHAQAVVLVFLRVLCDPESPVFVPVGLCFGLDFFWFVVLVHWHRYTPP